MRNRELPPFEKSADRMKWFILSFLSWYCAGANADTIGEHSTIGDLSEEQQAVFRYLCRTHSNALGKHGHSEHDAKFPYLMEVLRPAAMDFLGQIIAEFLLLQAWYDGEKTTSRKVGD